MANIKSAKKRILVAATRADRNKAIKSKIKTYTKKVEAAVAAGDKTAAAACCLFPICLSRFFCYFNMAYVLFCLLKWTTRQKTVSHPAFPDVYDSYTNLCDVIHIPCSPSCAESYA